ncbi:AAA family ATPase [Paludisphaera rhizosphaerae]|uniref:AAA family ATPase n=1 Tax=Paludisphaera rhizosphaerae TaxID=2711216 RepID=UPI0013ED80A8|nr:AAA family ATPase [Paludisphaera rhizosphaerae]
MGTATWDIEVTAPTRDFDRVEAAKAMRAIWLPGEVYALQGLPSGRWETSSLDRVDEALGLVGLLAGGKGVYTTINPLRRGFARGDKNGFNNGDFERRVWFFVDVDSTRPKGSNATDAEHAAALEKAAAIVEYTVGKGWPAPLMIDSGNGGHLYYRVDLPNDKLSQQLLSAVLRAWKARFDDAGATVDRSVHDVKRIARLPGTWSRKGPASPDRPHRRTRLLAVPDVEILSVDLLKAEIEISAPMTIVPPPPSPNGWEIKVRQPGAGGYANAALEDEVRKLLATTDGRNAQLYEAALKLGGYVASGELPELEVVGRLAEAGRTIGLGTDGDPHEVERAIANGMEVGKGRPKVAPAPKNGESSMNGAVSANGKVAEEPALPARIVDIIGDVELRKVSWLWPGLIPKNKLTTIAGAGGLGKSFVCCDLAARVSTGGEIPGGGGECFEVGNVLIINCEDDPEDTTGPRLFEAGADMRRIGILKSVALNQFTLAEVGLMRRAVAEMGSVSLIIIDPATAFVGKGVDDHKNAQLQGLLAPLRIAAWELGAAIVLVTHINKSGGNNVEAATRIVGGVAWVNAVRSAIIFAKDPDDPSRRLMLPTKSNNGPEKKGLVYRVVPTDALAVIEWEGETDTTPDDAIARTKKPGPKPAMTDDQVEGVFRRLFEGRTEVASKEAVAFCKEHGVSYEVARDARKRLGIGAKQRSEGWVWIAPYGFLASTPPS